MKNTPSGTALKDSGTEPRPDRETAAAATLESDDTPEPNATTIDKASERGQAAAPDRSRDDVPRRRWWAVRITAAALVALAFTATILAVLFGWKLKDRNDIDTASREASAAAQSYAVTLTSVDSQHIDQNFAAVLDGATGEFKNMYSQSSSQLKTLLVQNKAVSKGQVLDVGVKSATRNRVEVTLFVDQTITNSVSPDARVDRSRIVITMDRVGGRWLAEKVEMV